MKKIGIMLTVLGLIGMLLGFVFDSTVPTQGGAVHNIGLMHFKTNLILISIALFIGGVILWSVANITSRSVDQKIDLKRLVEKRTSDSHQSSVSSSPSKEGPTGERFIPLESTFNWFQRIFDLSAWKLLASLLQFIENHRRIAAVVMLFWAAVITWEFTKHIDTGFITFYSWITPLSLLIAAYYFFNGAQKPRRNVVTPVDGTSDPEPYTMVLRNANVNLVEWAVRLVFIVALLWYNDDYLREFKGRVFAIIPVLILLFVGLRLHTSGVKFWSIISIAVAGACGISILWGMIDGFNPSLEEILESIPNTNVVIPLPWGFDWGVAFLLASVFWPNLQGARFLGYRFGSHRLDVTVASKKYGQIVLPWYSAFVYGSVFSGLYYVVRISIMRLM